MAATTLARRAAGPGGTTADDLDTAWTGGSVGDGAARAGPRGRKPDGTGRDAAGRLDCDQRLGGSSGWTRQAARPEGAAGPPSTDIATFLDGCYLTSLDAANGPAYAACFGDEATWHVSADGTLGDWTAEYAGRVAISNAAKSTAYGGRATTYPKIDRTGPLRTIEDMVTYPFRTSAAASQTCQEGIHVIRLDAHRDRIAEQWTFCAPIEGAILSLPDQLEGTWTDGTTTLTLAACSVGEACGRLARVDGNGEHCFYEVSFMSGDPNGFRLATGLGNSFGCSYSGWSLATLRLAVTESGSIDLRFGNGSLRPLTRSASSPPSGTASPTP